MRLGLFSVTDLRLDFRVLRFRGTRYALYGRLLGSLAGAAVDTYEMSLGGTALERTNDPCDAASCVFLLESRPLSMQQIEKNGRD